MFAALHRLQEIFCLCLVKAWVLLQTFPVADTLDRFGSAGAGAVSSGGTSLLPEAASSDDL
jgi:hypothetical protein